MNKTFFAIIVLSMVFSASDILAIERQSDVEKIDSTSIVAKSFMEYDVFIGSYKIFDADLEWIEEVHPQWVTSYFPKIFQEYDCTLYTKFALAISMYKKGVRLPLEQLWEKWRYLFFVDDGRSQGYEIDPIWRLIDYSKVDILK